MNKTKLGKLLDERNITQADFRRLIEDKTGVVIGADRISKMVTGRLQNYSLYTARVISESLGVTIDDIVEF